MAHTTRSSGFCAFEGKSWGHLQVSNEDQEFWNAAIALAPDFPGFRRLDLSPEDRETQLQIDRLEAEFFDELAESSDDFEIDEAGNWSATFHLEEKPGSRLEKTDPGLAPQVELNKLPTRLPTSSETVFDCLMIPRNGSRATCSVNSVPTD